jgi:uncharacterized membrane protein (UPF0127 family)
VTRVIEVHSSLKSDKPVIEAAVWPKSEAPPPRVSPPKRRRPLLFLIVGIVLGVGLSAAVGALTSRPRAKSSPVLSVPYGDAVLFVRSHQYDLQLATTAAQQETGLVGRPSMPAGSGLLFVYTSTVDRCFWMKGMRFALDLIWLSSQDEVVSVQSDLSPRTYPSSYCSVAQDVLELNAGQARAAGIKVDDLLSINMPAV